MRILIVVIIRLFPTSRAAAVGSSRNLDLTGRICKTHSHHTLQQAPGLCVAMDTEVCVHLAKGRLSLLPATCAVAPVFLADPVGAQPLAHLDLLLLLPGPVPGNCNSFNAMLILLQTDVSLQQKLLALGIVLELLVRVVQVTEALQRLPLVDLRIA